MSNSAELLRRLAPGVGPAFQTAPVQRGPAGMGSAQGDFEALLAQAAAGTARTGLGIEIGPGSGVTLDQSQLDRVAQAADRAQAAGISTALVVIDGKSFVLDVEERTITAQADLTTPVAGIDGLVMVPALGKDGKAGEVSIMPFDPSAPALGLKGLGTPKNASLAALLSASNSEQSSQS